MTKLQMVIVFAATCFAAGIAGYLIGIGTGYLVKQAMPNTIVFKSTSTGECTNVITDGINGGTEACKHLPERYELVWVR